MTVWTRLCFAQITAARKNRQFTSHKAVRLAYLFFATVLAAFLYVMFEARFIAPLQGGLLGVAPFGAARRGRVCVLSAFLGSVSMQFPQGGKYV